MKPFPHLVLLLTVAAACALPFGAAPAGCLFFFAGLAAIISIDYSQRYRGLRVPRLTATTTAKRRPTAVFRAPPLELERNRLAA